MIYFFSSGREYVQREINPGRPHVLILISPDGDSHSERFTSASHLMERWQQLSDALQAHGWSGPFGRDVRF